jgi:hypothetical protein
VALAAPTGGAVELVAVDAAVPLQGSVRLDDWGHTIDLSGMQPPVM